MKTNSLRTIALMAIILAAFLAVAASRTVAADAPTAAPAVSYFDSKAMSEAFVKGKSLVSTPGYKVQTSRRTGPGQVEVHAFETDVFYIVEGSATFVTGGSVPDLKEVSPGQSRGTEIRGGEAYQLKPGDVIVIPASIPHWFKDVNGSILYFVTKPIAPAAAGSK